MNTLGIIAGGGEAPKCLIAACIRLGRAFEVFALRGQADDDIEKAAPVSWLALGEAGTLRTLATEKGVKEFVFLGRVRRPALSDLKPDGFLVQKLVRLAPAFLGGDDALLKAVAREFESEGFRIVAPQDVFADLLMPGGQLGKIVVPEEALADIKLGVQAALELGAQDIGQAVVVQQGVVIAKEDAEGTDTLIRRTGGQKREGRGPVLVKMKKPQQDVRFDLPSFGVETVKAAVAAGFSGIAMEAGASLLIDREEVVRVADAAGLFILGIDGNAT